MYPALQRNSMLEASLLGPQHDKKNISIVICPKCDNCVSVFSFIKHVRKLLSIWLAAKTRPCGYKNLPLDRSKIYLFILKAHDSITGNSLSLVLRLLSTPIFAATFVYFCIFFNCFSSENLINYTCSQNTQFPILLPS